MNTQIAAAAIALGTLEATTLAAPATSPTPTVWEVDSGHSNAQFKVRHLMVSNVRGTLGPISGTIHLDEKDVTRSQVMVSIDARAIDTKNPKRDEHLRSAEFLDVARYPAITFRSKTVRAGKAGALEVIGDLSIRGVTKSITLAVDALPSAVNDPWGNTKRGAIAKASLMRKDWGLSWNMALETGGVVVGDRVDIEIEVELLKRVVPPSGA